MTLRLHLACVLLLFVPLNQVASGDQEELSFSIKGHVASANNPIAGAKVRFQGSNQFAFTDSQGKFHLKSSVKNAGIVTAWKSGYAIAGTSAREPLKLLLSPLPGKDNENYQWVDPVPNPQQPNNCGNCHAQIYKEWQASAHGQSVHNKRFQNLFAGTDWHGKPSPKWNVLAEHPLGSAVCAICHAPTFNDVHLDYDMRKVPGVAARGVHCDYCHKIVDAPTDNLGTRFGSDGLILLRPKNQQQLFFGPLDDTFREGESFGYLPLYKESRYCASCHEGVVFGTHVYSTYSEWLKSPARQKGQQCQDCHMKPTGMMTNIAPGKGGVERDPLTLASHHFPGGTAEMLRQCLKLEVSVEPQGKELAVKVKLTAQEVGHRVPTGFVDRHLLLVVEGFDESGKVILPLKGQTLPHAVGKHHAGKAGFLYAKLLHDTQGKAPHPFWLPQGKIVDTRLFPETPDFKTFLFAPAVKQVRTLLIYRRFWQEVADAKQWPDSQIVVLDKKWKVN